MNTNILYGVIWFFIGHIAVWFQLNGNNQNLINKFLNLGFIKGSQTTELIKKI